MPNGMPPLGAGASMADAMDTYKRMAPPPDAAPGAGGADDIDALIAGVQSALDALKAATAKKGMPGMGAGAGLKPPMPM